MSNTLDATFRAECGTDGCCGCVTMTWIPDENAFRATCNECGKLVGWVMDSWDNESDRIRLGRDTLDEPKGGSGNNEA